MMPPVEVTANTPAPYPFGIFSVAPAATPPAGRWTSGVWWQSTGCNSLGVTYGPCNVEDDVPEKAVNVECGISTGAGFTVFAHSDESIGGSPVAEKFERARALVLSGEQFAVERTVWDLMLAATAVPDESPASLLEALALMEQHIAMLYGGTGVIHVSRYAATLLAADSLIRQTGARLTTQLGTPVVAGGGYTDDDLTAPVSVIATGALVVIRGELNNLGEHYDRAVNSISAVVERNYVVGWDCTVIRAEVASS